MTGCSVNVSASFPQTTVADSERTVQKGGKRLPCFQS
jgi:hypothetical protein